MSARPKNFRRSAAIPLLLGAVLLGASACHDASLTPLQALPAVPLSQVTLDARFCTSPRAQAQQKVKYIFILDHSQSNQPGFPNVLTPDDVTATDPTGARRYGPLVQFVQNLSTNTNNLTYFSLIDFDSNAYQPNGLNAFDASATDFINTYVNPDWIGSGTASAPSPADQGFTNYQAALQMALTLIQADAQAESQSGAQPVVASTYQIIFVSDGVPTIATPGSVSPVYTQTFTTDIAPVISNLLALATDPILRPFITAISLNTAYYFQNTPIPAAESLLLKMAQAGNGQSLVFGAGAAVFYQAFAPPIRNIRYQFSEAWVENQNVIAWDDGRILLDSDGDGLPDVIEQQLGSNPFAADSDGNGVSDLVEYRSKGHPCADTHCGVAGRDPYAICSGLAPTVAADGRVTFPASGGDGLNDCEKFVLGANDTKFDSNGDFIPDFLSLKVSIPFIAGTSGAFLNPFGDPLDNYEKLKAGYPLGISQTNLPSTFVARVNTLEHVASGSDDTDCYHLTTQNVSVLGSGNHLKVSIIENNSVIDDKPVLLSATHAWDGQSATVFFVPGDFH